MLTYDNLRDRVLLLLDEAGNTSTTADLVEDALNASHRRVCLTRPWPFMKWFRDETLTTVSGVKTYALNSNVAKLLYARDTVNREYLSFVPLRNWENAGIDPEDTDAGRPDATYGGTWPVSTQPSTAAVVSIVSSSASDGAGEQVYFRGILASGETAEETLTANGVTPVPSTNSYVYILNLHKIGTWVGSLTVSTPSETLLVLTSGVAARNFPTIEFVQTPAASKVYAYRFQRIPKVLTLDGDVPEVPYPYSEILVYDTLIDIAGYNTELSNKHLNIWGERYNELYKQLNDAMDESIVGSQPRYVRDMDGVSGHPVTLWSH